MNNQLISGFVKTLIVMLLLHNTSLFAAAADPTASTSFEASCYITKANKIRLALVKTTAEPLQITLRLSGERHVLFFRSVGRKETKAVFLLDVDQLSNGAYELEIKSATGSLVKQIKLETIAPTVTGERLLAVQ